MRGIVKFAILAACLSVLGLINMIMATRPLDTSPIVSENKIPNRLAGDQLSGGETGTGHIEELTFVQTFSRPLFSMDRRKYQPPPPPPPPKPAPKVAEAPPPKPVINPPDFRLMGVSVSGASARALIVGGADPNPQWVSEGESIGDWVLEKVLDGAITVTQDGAEYSIDLYPENR